MPREDWTIDHKIPIAFIVAVVIQTGGAFWWASKVESALATNGLRIDRLEKNQSDNRILYERMVRVEVKQENTNQLIMQVIGKIKGRDQ